MTMNWHYTVAEGHTHVRVFMNGRKCGNLCFRNEEFQSLLNNPRSIQCVKFIDEDWLNAEAKDINYQLNDPDEDRPY